MNTTNTPDRDEVITGIRSLWTEFSEHVPGPDYAGGPLDLLRNALTLLERDREAEKDRARLDFLSKPEWVDIRNYYGGYYFEEDREGSELQFEGGKSFDTHPSLRSVIDSAMATTTEKGEA